MTDDFSWLEPMDKLIEEIKEETKQIKIKNQKLKEENQRKVLQLQYFVFIH
jgi:hypothetical protein